MPDSLPCPLKKFDANGIEFAYYELTPESYSETTKTVFCLHGFPDSADGFLPCAAYIAAAGFRVIVPYTRGYYPTGTGTQGYSVDVLANDVLSLVDALADGEAFVVGHDWGMFSACLAAIREPAKIKAVVAMCVPHMAHAKMTIRQIMMSWYVLFFQLPLLPKKLLSKNNFAFIDMLYRRWSPNWPESDQTTASVKRCLANVENLDAAVGYYRAMARISPALYKELNKPVPVPALVLAGDADGSIDIAHFRDPAKLLESYPQIKGLKTYSGVGHFPHRENPAKTASDIIHFLESLND